jgi:hypothetical protein
LPSAAAKEALVAGHETLASAPPALRKAVESDLGPGGAAPLTASFTSTGAHFGSISGTWPLGLGSIGRAGALTAVPETKPSHEGAETTYRSGGLSEWFKDGKDGVEQGFTVLSRPAGRGPLVIALAVPGLSVHNGAEGALVLRQGSRAVLGYGDLAVRDATGSAVPAHLVPDGRALHIVVDDARAAYPLYIDPTWSQQGELTSSDGAYGDSFGYSVSLSGTTALVGAEYQLVGSNADQGAAYVFGYSGVTWSQQAELTASDGAGYDYFGISVSLSGTTALVGAYEHEVGSNPYQGSAYVFQPLTAPTVSSVSPSAGPLSGATTVAVTGTGFVVGSTTAEFGTTAASALSCTSTTSCTATAPPASLAGTVDIRLATAGGTSATSAFDQFNYDAVPTVSSVSPSAGPLSGAITVAVTGTGFVVGSTTATFGTTAASALSCTSTTACTATAPAGSAGTVDIRLATAGGTSATSTADQFSYDAVPTVSSVSPSAGPLSGATTVAVTGTGFVVGSTTAEFGTTAASAISCASTTSCTATAPADSLGGTVDIRLATAGGTSATSTADQFSYEAVPTPPGPAAGGPPTYAVPTVTALSPSAGPVAGGTVVTVSGTNFVVGQTTASFGATAAVLVSCSSGTTCVMTTPAHPSGTVEVTVSTPGGASVVNSADQFSFSAGVSPTVPAPVVASNPPGYWTVTAAGKVSANGSAADHGSVKNEVSAVVGIASALSGTGYWVVTAQGRVYSYGSARYQGGTAQASVGIVGITASPSGMGYWLVNAQGRVYAFGSARNYGSVDHAVGAVVGMASAPSGTGYWVVTAQGRLYAFGSARYYGSVGKAVGTVVGITTAPGGRGYWLAGANGDVYGFGSARPLGVAPKTASTVVGIAAS